MPASNTLETADDICREMAEIRSRLHQDMTEVVEGAITATDWRAFVRQHPWLMLGLSFGAGYMLVPRRRASTRVVLAPPGAAVGGTVLSAPAQAGRGSLWKAGLMASVGIVWPVLLRAAQGQALVWIEDYLARNPISPRTGQTEGGPRPASPPPGRSTNPTTPPSRSDFRRGQDRGG